MFNDELFIPPHRPERNLVNGRFLKGMTPHNKGKKWEDYMDEKTIAAMKDSLRKRVKGFKRYNIGGWNAKPIFALDDKGNIVGWFASANDAHRKTGIYARNIISVLHGKLKHAGGFRWIYDQRQKINKQ